jgi:uncharacterized oligopeptide transporter (OPT) family protein
VKKSDAGHGETLRTDKDMSIRWSLPAIGIITLIMFGIFTYFTGAVAPAATAAVVMLFLGFIFAAVSGYLVGIIGVSNNPTSGLTVSVLIVVAFIMVAFGLSGEAAIAAVLGIAAFTCTSVSVAGEMMQDLKAGHILGCTPWKMEIGDLFGITAAASIMFLVLSLLHLGDIKRAVGNEIDNLDKHQVSTVIYKGKNPDLQGKQFSVIDIRQMDPEQQNDILGTQAGFGGERLPAPQASLMAIVGRGIVEGKTELILIIAGMFMGCALILMQVKSPMLISVGMYLPIDTTFAIFLGGLMKGLVDRIVAKRALVDERKEMVSNVGVLLASGMIAGEALLGLLFAGLAFAEVKLFGVFDSPWYLASIACIVILGYFFVKIPIGSVENKE